MNNSIQNDINLLVEWADKAMCYSWLHNHSYHEYSFKDKCYTLPIIGLTTIAGTSTFAQASSMNISNTGSYISMGFGSLTILSGLLTAIKKFLKISEYAESHRISKMNWEKLYREIKIELTRLDNTPNTQKSNSNTSNLDNLDSIINKFKNQYNHLMETSPTISKKSIEKFTKEFQQPQYSNILKPEICGNMESTASITKLFKSTNITNYTIPLLPSNPINTKNTENHIINETKQDISHNIDI
jgi:hypothetical protein